MKGTEYIGKSKVVRRHSHANQLVITFTDRITDKDGLVRSEAPGKGRVACMISRRLFKVLIAEGVQNHYLGDVGDTGLVVTETEPLPLEVVVRRMAAGSLLTRIPVTKGQRLAPPLVEFFYKNDDWRDPLISDRHILLLGLCSATEIAEVIGSVERATDALARHFAECGIDLVDIKYEFGRTRGGRVILIDEITPEVFRAWDSTTGMSLDKDVFRDGSGSATVAYEALLARLETRYG